MKTRSPLDFKTLVTKYPNHYVDKTELIKEIISGSYQKVKRFSRPPGFGKTINLTMLYEFFSSTKKQEVEDLKLFAPFKIAKYPDCMREQGKYPVIYLDFGQLRETSLDKVIKQFIIMVKELYQQFDKDFKMSSTLKEDYEKKYFNSILDENSKYYQFTLALSYLTRFITKYYSQRPLILVDNYDIPILSALKYGFHKKIVYILNDFLNGGFGGSNELNFCQAILMSIIPLQSNLRVTTEYTLQENQSNKYMAYFGFTLDEVESLIQKGGIDNVLSQEQLTKEFGQYYCENQPLYSAYSTQLIASKMLEVFPKTEKFLLLIKEIYTKLTEEVYLPITWFKKCRPDILWHEDSDFFILSMLYHMGLLITPWQARFIKTTSAYEKCYVMARNAIAIEFINNFNNNTTKHNLSNSLLINFNDKKLEVSDLKTQIPTISWFSIDKIKKNVGIKFFNKLKNFSYEVNYSNKPIHNNLLLENKFKKLFYWLNNEDRLGGFIKDDNLLIFTKLMFSRAEFLIALELYPLVKDLLIEYQIFLDKLSRQNFSIGIQCLWQAVINYLKGWIHLYDENFKKAEIFLIESLNSFKKANHLFDEDNKQHFVEVKMTLALCYLKNNNYAAQEILQNIIKHYESKKLYLNETYARCCYYYSHSQLSSFASVATLKQSEQYSMNAFNIFRDIYEYHSFITFTVLHQLISVQIENFRQTSDSSIRKKITDYLSLSKEFLTKFSSEHPVCQHDLFDEIKKQIYARHYLLTTYFLKLVNPSTGLNIDTEIYEIIAKDPKRIFSEGLSFMSLEFVMEFTYAYRLKIILTFLKIFLNQVAPIINKIILGYLGYSEKQLKPALSHNELPVVFYVPKGCLENVTFFNKNMDAKNPLGLSRFGPSATVTAERIFISETPATASIAVQIKK